MDLLEVNETAVAIVSNDIVRAVDNGGVSVFMLLDLTAAFDAVDHSVLTGSTVLESWTQR